MNVDVPLLGRNFIEIFRIFLSGHDSGRSLRMDRSGDQVSATDYSAVAFRLKLGVAIAIIRSKPPDKTARQHTEYLITRFQCSIQDWERKLQNANREILTLKQRLTLSQFGGGRELDAIFPTPDSQGPEDQAGRSDSALPCSLSVVGATGYSDILQYLHSDAAFLSTALQRQLGSSGLGSRFQGRQLLRDTILQSCRSVAVALRQGRDLAASAVVKETVSLVVRATDQLKFSMDQDLKAGFQELLSALLEGILTTDALDEGRQPALRALQALLVQVSGSRWLPLVLLELESLLEAIAAWCGRARAARLGGCSPPGTAESENVVLVVGALHALVLGRGDVFRGAGLVCRDAELWLEQCLLHLVPAWPLLARALWQVSAALQQQCCSSSSQQHPQLCPSQQQYQQQHHEQQHQQQQSREDDW